MALGRGRPRRNAVTTTSTEPSTPAQIPSSAKPRRSLRGAIEIKNSSDADTDMDLEASVEVVNTSGNKGSWRMSEVRVPTAKPDTRSPSTVSSASVRRDRSGQYDTPGTSAVATPAELKVPERLSRAKVRALTHQLAGDSDELSAPLSSSIRPSNRKRSSRQNAKTLDDEALAQALQQEEYNQLEESYDAPSTSNPISKRGLESATDSALTSVADSGDDEFADSDSEPLAKRSKGPETRKPPRSVKFLNPAEMNFAGIFGDDEDAELSDVFRPSEAEESELSELPETQQPSDVSDAGAGRINFKKPKVSAAKYGVKRKHGVKRKRGPSPSTEESFHRIPGWRTKNRAQRDRIRTEHYHPDIVTLWDDLRQVPIIKPERRPQPVGLSRQLKPFQLEGVDWMLKQEQTHYKGGLLGDEMGMGKTIQAVSLMMSDHPAPSPTLVVVPPVALVQWSSEIASYTDGKFKVLIHHNTDPKVKKLTEKDLRKYDVIMISYSGLESIYRKENKGWKRGDELVKANSRIHAIKYHRLILDEAHNIKQRTTGVAQACFALKADYKWCLSGTPVQNRIGEFFSLLRFLQVKPFASYFCKRCECADIHWEQDDRKRCKRCKHSGFSHFSIFNKELLEPITGAMSPMLRKEGMQKLRLVTDRIMLRRMKKDHTSSMELPAKQVDIHNEFFGDIERDFSSSIMSNTTRQFDTYVSRGVMLNNYANIFGLIMQMRQVANHPDLILKKHAAQGQNVLVCCICDEPAEEAIRSRCHHEFCRKCARDYIRSFEEAEGAMDASPGCPRCHIPLTIDFEQPDIEQDEDVVSKNSIINRINMDRWTSSTKIEMLIYDLYKLRSPDKTAKSIVFSQFTSMLQLVEWRLRKAGISTVMLDGSMSPAQRQRSIEYFMTNIHVEVFLVSLKAGGVALNLTEASRVFIVDPWWNPAAEHQSADRCHRIGQRRACNVTRLVIEDSVESRMVLLQEKKSNMIAGTVDGDDVAIEKLTPEDMGFLFRSS